jgi:aminoglycoside phosphotransferase (APT) family kinase protein
LNEIPLRGVPRAEVTLDVDQVRVLLREQHPDLAELSITPFENGWDNALFRLGDHLIARFPRREIAAALARNEQRWLPQLAPGLPLPIPAPLRIGAPSALFPWSWSVVPWLTGTSADRVEPRSDQACVLAAFWNALHRPAPADAPHNAVRGVPLRARADVVQERIERLQRTTAAISRALLDVWHDALCAPLDADDTWIHGDLHARNVLVHEGRISAVIDWGDIAQGDCATDLAALWMLLGEHDARRAARDSYRRVSESTWRRARGWAVLFGVTLLDTGLAGDPRQAAVGERTLRRVLEGP